MENYNPGSGKNNWNYKRKMTDEEYEMTRAERARANAKKIKETKRKIILDAITGMFKHKYIKDDGTWNIYRLSKDLKMSHNTIRKHLKELKEEGMI
jgi:DNA-binding transcriptional ArsR family regulator